MNLWKKLPQWLKYGLVFAGIEFVLLGVLWLIGFCENGFSPQTSFPMPCVFLQFFGWALLLPQLFFSAPLSFLLEHITKTLSEFGLGWSADVVGITILGILFYFVLGSVIGLLLSSKKKRK